MTLKFTWGFNIHIWFPPLSQRVKMRPAIGGEKAVLSPQSAMYAKIRIELCEYRQIAICESPLIWAVGGGGGEGGSKK